MLARAFKKFSFFSFFFSVLFSSVKAALKREEPSKGGAVTCHFLAKCKEIILE